MALVITGWQLLSFQVLAGIAMGGIMPIISALLANFSISGEEGAVYGLDHSISAAGRAVAPMLGAALAAAFSIRATFVACGLIFLFSALFAIVKLPKTEQAKLPSVI
jgi:DHA1 family multidrug resistance protein-like MFS transporter